MSLLVILLIVSSVITVALILLLIYRSVVSMKEDDQLFLSQAEAQLQREQQEILARLNQVAPYVKVLGVTSGVLWVVTFGVWLYQGLAMVR